MKDGLWYCRHGAVAALLIGEVSRFKMELIEYIHFDGNNDSVIAVIYFMGS